MANFLVWCVWMVAALACVASALGVVSFRNPFFSALALIGNLASLAVLFLLLGGEFVAAAQVLVYGGAVMVMFLFVIAYLGEQTAGEAPWAGGPSWQVVAACLAGGAILVEVIVAIGLSTGGSLSHSANIERSFGSPGSIGTLFLTDHLIAFEVTSIILLVAAVGGVVLGAHARSAEIEIEERGGTAHLIERGAGSTEPQLTGGAGLASAGGPDART
jgi:NADH:ubiquinone oxidoreductase subunit 6 (subunit J)